MSVATATPASDTAPQPRKMELVCPAGTMTALKTAAEAGADAIYFGFRDRTNARNFPGLNFTPAEAEEAVALCKAKGVNPMVAVNTYPVAGHEKLWHDAVDTVARIGAHAIIVADIGLAAYVAEKHPDLRLHLSVQASASNPEAVAYYAETFGVQRVVLPRVFSLEEIRDITAAVAPVETEVFVFGGLCVMAEGRCSLSAYVTGCSPNKDGACSPASSVRYVQQDDVLISKLGDYTINRFEADEDAGYPTLCKGRYVVNGEEMYLFEDPASLDATPILGELAEAGVAALKVEGRQRGKAYVQAVVGSLRQSVDALASGGATTTGEKATAFMEGLKRTQGVYQRDWR